MALPLTLMLALADNSVDFSRFRRFHSIRPLEKSPQVEQMQTYFCMKHTKKRRFSDQQACLQFTERAFKRCGRRESCFKQALGL